MQVEDSQPLGLPTLTIHTVLKCVAFFFLLFPLLLGPPPLPLPVCFSPSSVSNFSVTVDVLDAGLELHNSTIITTA